MVRFPDICKDCTPPRRNAHCHATCPEYLAAKEEHERKAKEDRKRRNAERDADAVAFSLSKG